MAIAHSIWSLEDQTPLPTAELISEEELEDILDRHIEILSEDWLVVGRQVHTVAGGYIDLLCMDRSGDTIVVELKKDLTPREVTAQVIDYASCVSRYTSSELADVYLGYSGGSRSLNEAFCDRFGFELDEENVNQRVRMVIVASRMDASTERIIEYLGQFHVDINILFFSVFQCGDRRLLSRAWFKEESETAAPRRPQAVREWNSEYYVSFGQYDGGRNWADARRYGFVCGGGGSWYTRTLHMLSEGDRVWVNIPHTGYVGVGEVISGAMRCQEAFFEVDGAERAFGELQLKGAYPSVDGDEDSSEQLVKVRWLHTVSEADAVRELGFFGNQNTVCKPTSEKWEFTIRRLKEIWGLRE